MHYIPLYKKALAGYVDQLKPFIYWTKKLE